MKLLAVILAGLVPLANGAANPCLVFCRTSVMACIKMNVNVLDTSALASCILTNIKKQENPDELCQECIVTTLAKEGCTREDGTTDMDCVDASVTSDKCNTSYPGEEECGADSTCQWCPDYGVCASMASCENFAPEDGGEDGDKPKKDKADLKFECKAMADDASADLACMNFGGKKKCEGSDSGCQWVKKAAGGKPAGGSGKSDTITSMKELKKVCKNQFTDADSCLRNCAKGKFRVRKNKTVGTCTPKKNPPADCRFFQDAEMCDMVRGCTMTANNRCKGEPQLDN